MLQKAFGGPVFKVKTFENIYIKTLCKFGSSMVGEFGKSYFTSAESSHGNNK